MKKHIEKRADNPHEGHRERLRKKIDVDSDLETFADHEILEFRLGLVIPRRDTNELAHQLLNSFGSLDSVLSATPKELFEVCGMTMSAAYMLATDLAFVRKALRSADKSKKLHLKSPEACIKTMYTYFIGRKTECLCIAFVDKSYNILKINFLVSESGHKIALNVSDITKRAIREGAFGVLIAHNHPSTTVTPSTEDIVATEDLVYTLSAANIQLIDHLIIKNKAVFSFNNNGILAKFKSEFAKRSSKIVSSDSDAHIFLGNFQEFVIDPKSVAGSSLKTIPKEQLIDELFKFEKTDEIARKQEEENIKTIMSGVIINSVIIPDAYKALNDKAGMEVATTTPNEEEEIISYEIDPDEIF